MISFRNGVSIFDTEANIIVNPVNCVGVMGSGLALEFRNRFIDNYWLYYDACHEGKVKPGKVFVTYANNADGLTIVNFPTKDHWIKKSKLKYIEKGLQDLLNYLHPGDTIAIPLLGCGLGGLNSYKVIPMFYRYLKDLKDVDTIICTQHYNSLAELI